MGKTVNQDINFDGKRIIRARLVDCFDKDGKRIATLAEKDGYYPNMRVGLADNVSGSTATAEEFVSKTSDADGFAEIASIKGKSAVSRNIWDEQWEVGSLDASGNNYASTARIRGKNYIPCLPNKDYYILSSEICDIHFYTEDKVHIDGYRQIKNTVFTTPSGAAYIRFCEAIAYGTTYNNDICINKSDPSFNGQYEPYWEGIRSFHGTAIKTTGLHGEESTLALPELPEGGLRSAGSAYDELTPTKNITRIGVVALGGLTWYQNGSNPQYYSTGISSLIAKPASTSAVANVLCSQYITLSRDAVDHANGVGVSTAGNITIRDDRYPTLAEFQAAISGVMLFYELVTPIEVSVPTRNLIYKTYEGGTESVIPSDMPIKADIIRSVNLPKDFISKASFDKFCTALGAAINKTITATWDATSKTYNFTIV